MGALGMPLGAFGRFWVPASAFGVPLAPLGGVLISTCVNPWVHLGCLGCAFGVPLGAYGRLRVPMGCLWVPWVPLGYLGGLIDYPMW